MNTPLKLLIGILVTLTLVSSQAQINRYITDDGLAITPEIVETSMKSKDSLPAELYSEANWGAPAAGFQLSLRFQTNVFAIGQPINETILLRNVTSNDLVYISAFALDWDYHYNVLNGQNQQLQDLANPTSAAGQRRYLPRGRQHQCKIELEKRFAINAPGKYSITAKRKVPTLDKNDYTEVSSATVSIELISTNELYGIGALTNNPSRKP